MSGSQVPSLYLSILLHLPAVWLFWLWLSPLFPTLRFIFSLTWQLFRLDTRKSVSSTLYKSIGLGQGSLNQDEVPFLGQMGAAGAKRWVSPKALTKCWVSKPEKPRPMWSQRWENLGGRGTKGQVMSGTGREGKQSQVQVKSKMDRWERYSTFLDWKNQYCQNDCTTQGNLQIQCSPYQITNFIFHRTKTKKF